MKEVPFVPLAINRGHNEFSRETRESRDGIRGRGPLNDEPPSREKKKKEIEKKKRFRSFVRGDTIFVISNNRRSPRERERLADTHGREKILRASRRAEFNDRGYLANITYHEIRERDRNVK